MEIMYLSFDGETYVLWDELPEHDAGKLIFTCAGKLTFTCEDGCEIREWEKEKFESTYPDLILRDGECSRVRITMEIFCY